MPRKSDKELFPGGKPRKGTYAWEQELKHALNAGYPGRVPERRMRGVSGSSEGVEAVDPALLAQEAGLPPKIAMAPMEIEGALPQYSIGQIGEPTFSQPGSDIGLSIGEPRIAEESPQYALNIGDVSVEEDPEMKRRKAQENLVRLLQQRQANKGGMY